MRRSRTARGALRRGFTLIELLTALSIITIIAGMLLPAVVRARESARQSVCLSNERQFGLAFAQYTQDWDDRLPAGTAGFMGQGWCGQLFPYIRDPRIYRCPDDVKLGEDI